MAKSGSSYHVIKSSLGKGRSIAFKVKKSQSKLNVNQKAAFARLAGYLRSRGKSLKSGETCPVIFFAKGKTAVQRCANAKTFKSARWAQAAKKRAATLCHAKSGPHKGHFVRCAKRRK